VSETMVGAAAATPGAASAPRKQTTTSKSLNFPGPPPFTAVLSLDLSPAHPNAHPTIVQGIRPDNRRRVQGQALAGRS
jgi:hypothetical protein